MPAEHPATSSVADLSRGGAGERHSALPATLRVVAVAALAAGPVTAQEPDTAGGARADTVGTDSATAGAPAAAHAPTAAADSGGAPPPGAPLSLELAEMDEPAPPWPEPGPETSGTTWINSEPLTWEDLRGKVVLVDFMEYTCINCIRTFDDNLRLWRRYRDRGFTIVGVHAPEFEVAYEVENVRRAVERFGLDYPVVVDNWFRIWKAYDSHIWPNRFLVDHTGTIRYHKAGEGADAALEEAIRELLREADPGVAFPDSMEIPEPENAFADACGRTTAEIYAGIWHGRGSLANEAWYRPGEVVDYELPSQLSDGSMVLRGPWETNMNGMIYRGNQSPGTPEPDQLSIAYTAREVYAVMNVARAGEPTRIYISQDGRWLARENAGVDVRFDGEGRSYLFVDEPRMYYLVSNPRMGQHFINLVPVQSGLMVNAFTFGNDCQIDFPHR